MLLGIAGVLLVVPVALTAQQNQLYMDVGTSRMRFADSVDATALSVSPALRTFGTRGSFNAFGTLSRLAGSWSNSATVSGTVNSRRRGALTYELEGMAAGSAHSDGGRTGQMLGVARVHARRALSGTWAGAGLGRTWDGTALRTTLQGDIGGWMESLGNSLSASIMPTQVDDDVGYADVQLAAQRETGPWELGASVGVRAGDQLPSLQGNRSVWGSIGVLRWLSPILGISASAGTYPVDITQGYPGGQYLSLALRVRPRLGTPFGRSRMNEPGAVTVATVSGSQRQLRVFAPGARSVDVYGDFTRWDPLSLQSEGNGWWTGTLEIPSGTHEMNVRIDGGPWLAPPGLPTLRDEFGGSTGLLVVP